MSKGDRDCNNCGYKDSMYCLVCVDLDMHKTEQEKRCIEAMCDLMCPDDEGV